VVFNNAFHRLRFVEQCLHLTAIGLVVIVIALIMIGCFVSTTLTIRNFQAAHYDLNKEACFRGDHVAFYFDYALVLLTANIESSEKKHLRRESYKATSVRNDYKNTPVRLNYSLTRF